MTDGTVSWAPVYAAYGDNNRSCMLRLPRNRPAIENRGVDSAANTYVTAALMLAAGLEGIRLGLDPGDPVEDLTYDWETTSPGGRVRLPRTLLEAVDAFARGPARARGVPRAVRLRLRRHEAGASGTTTTARSPTGSAPSTCSPSDGSMPRSPCSSAANRSTATRCTAGYVDALWAAGATPILLAPPPDRAAIDRYVEATARL